MIPDFLSVTAGFPATLSINPPRYASCSSPWELDAASGFDFLLALASGFPVDALSITGLSDAIGWFMDEELVETVDVRFIAVGCDFATILSSFFSCILFAIVEELIKRKSLVQQVELKWLILNKVRRLFHSSRVKFPLLKCLRVDVWCRCIEFESWDTDQFVQTTNPEQPCGFLTRVSLLDSCLSSSS